MRDKLLESIKQLIEKTSISPEDKADNDALKSIYLKRLDRRNAKLTDEEKSLLQKYGLKTDGSDIGPSGYVGTPRGNVFSNRRDRTGSFNKINYADRARKIKNRIERDIIGKNEYDRPAIIDSSSNKVNDYNELRNLGYSRQMQKNVNKMNHYLNKRRMANLELDSIDSRRASREADIKAKYDSEIKSLNRWYDYTKQSSTDDIAQSTDEINKLLKRKPQTESLSEVEEKAREAQNPVYADAIRGIKRADKAREEYRKLPKAEEREENPKVKGNSDMKKMYLSESLFEDSDFTYEGDYIVTVYSYRDGSYKTYIEQCNDNHEAAAWFDELNQMTDDKLVENGIDGFAWLTIDDDGTTVIVDERISGYADTEAVQREIDYYVNTKQQNESLNESTSNVDINKLSNFIKNAVNGLTKNDESTWYFHLVDNLYYVIGVVNPENYDKEDLKILALSKDGWVICGKIAVNIDDMQSDYELDWYMPYEKDGEVWDTERDFYKNDDYTKVAQDIIRDLHNFDNVTVDKNGEIITNKITDEACKSKKRVKKQLKEDSEIHVFNQIPDEEIYDQADYVFSDDGLYGKDYTDGLIIGGNRDYSSIIYSKEHKDEIKDLLYSGYSSDEIVQELNKITGKTYVADQISGYSQSDWNNIYYPTGEFSNDSIREIEDAYFGKYTAYDDGNELVVVFDSDRRPVKEIISDQTGIPVNQIKIRKFTGYTRTPNYEDDED